MGTSDSEPTLVWCTKAAAKNTLFAPGSEREVPVDSMFHNLLSARLIGAGCVLEVYDVLAGLVLNHYFALSQLVFESCQQTCVPPGDHGATAAAAARPVTD